jgi:hypothetical protein
MNISFGIITNGKSDDSVNAVIDSIETQQIPCYEIIIVGNSQVCRKNTYIFNFNESYFYAWMLKQKRFSRQGLRNYFTKSGWITRKKNIITSVAAFENIVFCHDYVSFDQGWYKGFLEFGGDFAVCMSKIVNPDGSRFRDWMLCPWNGNFLDELVGKDLKCLLPYEMGQLSKYMYISGTYWVAKKSVMSEFPLDESLCWGQGEDVQWSKQVRQKYNFSMNCNSTVRLLKTKDPIFSLISEDAKAILSRLQ